MNNHLSDFSFEEKKFAIHLLKEGSNIFSWRWKHSIKREMLISFLANMRSANKSRLAN